MDPFHVVRLGGDALDDCGRGTQQVTLRHRGRAGDPLYGARRTLHTGTKRHRCVDGSLAVGEGAAVKRRRWSARQSSSFRRSWGSGSRPM